MSPSIRPTAAPDSASANAKLAATVLLPTPPLPLATNTTLRTPGIRSLAVCMRLVSAVKLTFTSFAPRFFASAAFTSPPIWSLSGQAGVVSCTVSSMLPPLDFTSLIMPSSTRSCFRSGSCTPLRADLMSCSVQLMSRFPARWGTCLPPPPRAQKAEPDAQRVNYGPFLSTIRLAVQPTHAFCRFRAGSAHVREQGQLHNGRHGAGVPAAAGAFRLHAGGEPRLLHRPRPGDAHQHHAA